MSLATQRVIFWHFQWIFNFLKSNFFQIKVGKIKGGFYQLHKFYERLWHITIQDWIWMASDTTQLYPQRCGYSGGRYSGICLTLKEIVSSVNQEGVLGGWGWGKVWVRAPLFLLCGEGGASLYFEFWKSICLACWQDQNYWHIYFLYLALRAG